MDLKRIDAVKKKKLIYLTTRGRKTGKPHIVEIWFAFADGKVYLSHEGDYTDWMKNIRNDGHVKAKINGVQFDGFARILEEGDSRELGKRALYEKYYGPAGKEVIDDWFELSTVLELTPV
jgi:deazaflavin-dependent oxidoreductase (nitroreductase family)